MGGQEVGFTLVTARRRAGLTQSDVAELMGTTQSAVSRVEAGRAQPTLDFVERYARAVGTRLTLEFGAQAELPSRDERRERARRVLRGYVFDPWRRAPSPAEQRSLEADGLTRERFQGQTAAR